MLKKLGLGLVGLIATAGIAAYAAGAFSGFPIVGDTTGATVCLSYGNNSVCNQYSPAGPATIPSGALIPADTGSTNQPTTVLIPYTSLGAGNTTVNTTTGAQSPVVAAGVSTYVYAGAGVATFTTFTLPPSPTNNQQICIANATANVVTLSSIVVSATPASQLIVGVTPTSLPAQVVAGTALATVCYLYNQPNLTWYRVL